jgi:hypothetical protein
MKIFKRNKTPLYIVDGSESYCKESDRFNLRNSSVKLVKEIGEHKVLVVYDDDMFWPPSVYTIDTRTNEILFKSRYTHPLLRQKFRLLRENLRRGIVPSGIEDRRFK